MAVGEAVRLAAALRCTRGALVGYSKASGLRQAFQRYWEMNPSDVQVDLPEELYAEVHPPD